MQTYLSCMKQKKGMNDPACRDMAKAYLECRMDRYAESTFDLMVFKLTYIANDRNLMAKDEFKNLGFPDEKPPEQPKASSGADKGTKGELNW